MADKPKMKQVTIDTDMQHENIFFPAGTHDFNTEKEEAMRIAKNLEDSQARIQAVRDEETKRQLAANDVLGVSVSGENSGVSVEQVNTIVQDALAAQLEMLKNQGLLKTPEPASDEPTGEGENKTNEPANPPTPAGGGTIRLGGSTSTP